MNDLQAYQPYIFLIAGFAIMLYAFLKKGNDNLLKNGIPAEGIIFELKGKSNYGGELQNDRTYNIIIVRFVTKKLEWITAEAKNEMPVYYTGQYKIGEKVNVKYDPDNPQNFIIITKQSESQVRLIMIIAGLVFMLVGIIQLLKIF